MPYLHWEVYVFFLEKKGCVFEDFLFCKQIEIGTVWRRQKHRHWCFRFSTKKINQNKYRTEKMKNFCIYVSDNNNNNKNKNLLLLCVTIWKFQRSSSSLSNCIIDFDLFSFLILNMKSMMMNDCWSKICFDIFFFVSLCFDFWMLLLFFSWSKMVMGDDDLIDVMCVCVWVFD